MNKIYFSFRFLKNIKNKPSTPFSYYKSPNQPKTPNKTQLIKKKNPPLNKNKPKYLKHYKTEPLSQK